MSARPRNWWDTEDPRHLRDELSEIDQELVAFGINYPLGARGVRDMRGFAERYRRWLSEVVAVVGFPPDGDYDRLAEHIRAKLAE